MKRKARIFLAIIMSLQLLLSGIVTVSAEDVSGIGEAYTEPESPAVTYNMNLDWKFYDTKTDVEIWSAMAKADKDGKKFYEVGYDDSDWETVSIPHGIGGGTNSFASANTDAGGGYRSVLLYRKTFTVPEYAEGSKVFFELEGIRQAAYVWVNGQEVGYYEAGITAMGFDLTNYVEPGEEAVIAILNDGTTARGTSGRIPYETVPGEKWGSSYTPDNYNTTVGGGAQFVWNTKDFNEPQIGLVYDAYLHIKGSVYQTLPLYNNLKTTGNYIYADNFDIRANEATIHVEAEVRNESAADGDYTLEVAVVDADGNLKYNFESEPTAVAKATDAGIVYETAVESDAYSPEKIDYAEKMPDSTSEELELINDASKRPDRNEDNVILTYNEHWTDWLAIDDSISRDGYDERGYRIKYGQQSDDTIKEISNGAEATHYQILQSVDKVTHNEINATEINTPDVTYITASYDASDVRFWSLDDPYLYTVYTILKDGDGNVVDVQEKETGFRKVTYDPQSGILINDRAVWLKGYAQRSTNEWAVIGTATDWLQDYDMQLLKENNANFIRWMHVAPKPAEVRSSDKYGVAVVCPAGDKEGTGLEGRQWSQRTEAMRDAMIYFRNSPSVIFWETGNSSLRWGDQADEMANLRDEIDPHGMRFIGARSTTAADQLNYEYNYAGTMYGTNNDNRNPKSAIASMEQNGIMGPIMETEYARDEAPRRVWDVYSPPDFDYVNKFISTGGKEDGYDVWDLTQEEAVINNITEYNGYYSDRVGSGDSIYSAAAMMVWSDSNMHTRNTATENCRTSGRVDPVRQKKEMFEGTRAAQADGATIHIVGHWSYPEVTDDTYNYFDTDTVEFEEDHTYEAFNDTQLKRDPTTKTVYVIGSADVDKVELYRIDGETETLLGTDEDPDSTFIYSFENIDVTQGDGVIAKAYNVRGEEVTTDEIERTGEAATLRVTPHTAVAEGEDGEAVSDWRADGSDIAYFDIEVLDENGNVCALNYDRIDLSWSGEGTFLGGYNGGTGAGCFQNTQESAGLSNYFGGMKDGVSTIGQNYVYAENGTNRIFVRSTRNAGEFTLTATMDGLLPVSATITSNAVETVGGLTTQMQSELEPGVSEPPVTNTVDPMKPLMLNKLTIDWSNVKTVTEEDTRVYYEVQLNGEPLTLSERTYLGTMNTLFGPIYEILTAAQNAGASGFTMTYNDSVSPVTLEVAKDGHTYQYEENRNQLLIDNTEYTECVDTPYMEGDTFIANLPLMLGYAGIRTEIDDTNHVLNIIVE